MTMSIAHFLILISKCVKQLWLRLIFTPELLCLIAVFHCDFQSALPMFTADEWFAYCVMESIFMLFKYSSNNGL